MYFMPKDPDVTLGTVPEPERLAEGECRWSEREPETADDDDDAGGPGPLSPTSKHIHRLAVRAGIEPEALMRLLRLDARQLHGGSSSTVTAADGILAGEKPQEPSELKNGSLKTPASATEPALSAAPSTDAPSNLSCPRPAVKFVLGPTVHPGDPGGGSGPTQVIAAGEGEVGTADKSLLSKRQSMPSRLAIGSSPLGQIPPMPRLSPGRVVGSPGSGTGRDAVTPRSESLFESCQVTNVWGSNRTSWLPRPLSPINHPSTPSRNPYPRAM